MRAGNLRQYVTIEQPATVSPDSYGDLPASYTKYLDCWAEVEPLSARESYWAKQTQSLATHRITLRYIEGVTSQMRIKLGSRYFNLESVINVKERNEELLIQAIEVV